MSEWQSQKIGSLIQLITKGTTPSKAMGGFSESGINYIKSESISYDGRIDSSKFAFIDEKVHRELKRSQLQKDDILFSMAGAYLGKSAIVQQEHLPANTNQALAIIRLDQSKANPKFINYFFRHPNVINYVNNLSGQSAQPNINFEEIKSIEVALPPLPEQKAIASVLSSLDDKIDLLHRQNKTLEAMAETLFRQWFIEDESLDEVAVSELVTFNPKRTLAKGTESTYLEMAGLSTQNFNATGYYKREFTSGTKFIHQDTLLARITPCLENGKAGYVTFLSDTEVGWGSTEYIVMRPKSGIHPLMAYVLCRNQDFKDYAESCMEGSSGRQRVNVEHLQEFTIGKPTDEVIQQFNEYLESIETKLIYNSKQIQTLKNLRDTLLPKLMSGEVRVQYQTEEVA